MNVTLAAPTFDIDGHVLIETLPDNTDGVTRRRVNREATLDQDVVISDGGYADGDRELLFNFLTVSRAHNEQIARMVRLYSLVTVTTDDGVYTAAPEAFSPGLPESALRLLVKEKIV